VVFEFRPLANLRPVFFAYIFVDLDWPIALVESIRAIATWSRDPIIFATLNVVVVRFETASA
jgi:hypothetical protein